MRLHTLLSVLALGLTALPATSEEVAPPPSFACTVVNERSDWIDIFERTDARWGVSVEAQLALIAEEWQIHADNIPSRWRPEWTILDRGEPGIQTGYFEATWQRYQAETNNLHASPNRLANVSDFIGWYFASSSEYVEFLPGDAAAFYIIWRRGPRYYETGQWQRNTGLIYRAQTFAENAQQISHDLQSCPVDHAGSGENRSLSSGEADGVTRPWTWHRRHSASENWIGTLRN